MDGISQKAGDFENRTCTKVDNIDIYEGSTGRNRGQGVAHGLTIPSPKWTDLAF